MMSYNGTYFLNFPTAHCPDIIDVNGYFVEPGRETRSHSEDMCFELCVSGRVSVLYWLFWCPDCRAEFEVRQYVYYVHLGAVIQTIKSPLTQVSQS